HHSQDVEPICDRFEAHWAAGNRVAIEDLLAEVDEGVRPILLQELIQIEVWWRRQLQEVPSSKDYLSRFPEQAKVVENAWSQLEQSQATTASPDGETLAPRLPGSTIFGTNWQEKGREFGD